MPTPQADLSRPLFLIPRLLEIGVSTKAPPKEILLFKMGLNETMYGPIYCDRTAIESCMMFETAMHRDCCLDFNHNTEKTNDAKADPELDQAAGWFSLRADRVGLWASAPTHMRDYIGDGIYWTPYGAQKVLTGGYRYDSPAALCEERPDGKLYLKAITSCALTNKPAKIGFSPILFGAPKMEKLLLFCQQLTGAATEDEIITGLSKIVAEQREQRINAILLEYRDRFAPEERPSLSKIGALDHELLAETLKARKALLTAPVAAPVQPLRAMAPAVPQPPAQGAKPITELSYKERHILANGDPKLYEAMVATHKK